MVRSDQIRTSQVNSCEVGQVCLVRSYSGRSGPVGQISPGHVGSVLRGQVSTGQLGQIRSGQVSSGYVRLDQVGSFQARSVQVRSLRSSQVGQVRSCWSS